jgi:sugar O-acyltransferase (sialic acid O-acetyltransferase NeuD family)
VIDAIVFWGGSGQAKVLRELLSEDGPPLVAIFDNSPDLASPWSDVPLYHGQAGFEVWKATQTDLSRIGCLVAIGGRGGADRLRIQRGLAAQGLRPLVAQHRSAFVAGSARVGPGSQILAHAVVAVDALLGEACIVNTAATVDHECILGDGVHVCPGAHLAGLVSVGDEVTIGTGAIILPRLSIGAGATIGAGAVVTANVPAGVCVVGNPARPLEKGSR